MYSYFAHPNNMRMTYYRHFFVSFRYSTKLFIGSIKALIHAIIPSLYVTSTTELVLQLNSDLLGLMKK